jgi:hypothetical protein
MFIEMTKEQRKKVCIELNKILGIRLKKYTDAELGATIISLRSKSVKRDKAIRGGMSFIFRNAYSLGNIKYEGEGLSKELQHVAIMFDVVKNIMNAIGAYEDIKSGHHLELVV